MNEAFVHTKSKLQRKKMARPGQAGQKIPTRASLLFSLRERIQSGQEYPGSKGTPAAAKRRNTLIPQIQPSGAQLP